MTNYKYCHNCKHCDFCAIKIGIDGMAGLLVANLNTSIDEKNGYQNIIEAIAHDCKRFKAFDDDDGK